MKKVKLTVIKSNCRCNYLKKGDTFIVDDLCPPLCIELWNSIYPYLFALKNGAILDKGDEKAKQFTVKCPDEGRVEVLGEVIKD